MVQFLLNEVGYLYCAWQAGLFNLDVKSLGLAAEGRVNEKINQ